MITSYLTIEAINWKFISPRSTNFRGLWEARVKAFKYHLKNSSWVTQELPRILLITIIDQIEEILKFSSFAPLSPDSNEIKVLTPGHFLTGYPSTVILEPQFMKIGYLVGKKYIKLT